VRPERGNTGQAFGVLTLDSLSVYSSTCDWLRVGLSEVNKVRVMLSSGLFYPFEAKKPL
jgi:hypothetical protein